MKTPREILLERHQTTDDKLDAIRQDIVAAMPPRKQRRTNDESFLSSFNRQIASLFRSRAWFALAPLWVIILALKLSTQESSPAAASRSSVSPELAREVRQQKVFFAELIGATDSRDADRPKTFSPRPRSEVRFETVAV